MKKNNILFLLISSLFFFSCINDEGEGGTGSIEGYVYKVVHPDEVYNFKADTFPASKEDVYIVYGNDAVYGDKMDAHHDGFFKFKYLTKGLYKIYSYSTHPDGRKVAVIDTVILASGETKRTQDIYIHEGKSLDKSYIKGQVLVNYYDKGNLIAYQKTGAGIRVYIRVKGAPYFFDEVRAGADGIFMFEKLNPGEYEVYVLTEAIVTEVVSPVIQSVTITQKGVIEEIATPFVIVVNV